MSSRNFVFAAVFVSGIAWAQAPINSNTLPLVDKLDVDRFNGAYRSGIEIDVPPFRGIEPDLSLAYNSASTNGLLGVGWSLPTSIIERASPGRGAPEYGAGDVYQLDGQDLVPCATGSVSPSCTSGGGYTTKIENYARIALVGSTWTITARDGTKSIYAPIVSTSSGTFRWGLSSVTDTRGNTVTYQYAWLDSGNAAVSQVTYNKTLIRLLYENRPDPITIADGVGILTTTQRLATIDVLVNGARVRAYQLSYTTSADTGRSLLASVRQYGKDAALNGYGPITGGTSLPATTITSSVSGTTGWTSSTVTQGVGPDIGVGPVGGTTLTGDLNGDGKADLWYGSAFSGTWQVMLSSSTGIVATTWPGPTNFYSPVSKGCLSGDLNGDGKTDMWCETADGTGSWDVRISTGTGWTASTMSGPSVTFPISDKCLTGDLDGDGKADFWCVSRTAGTWDVRKATTTVTGAFAGWTQSTWSGPTLSFTLGASCMTGDVNGDGKTDFWCENSSAGGVWTVVKTQPSGNAWTVSSWTGPAVAWPIRNECMSGDLDGDGKADFWCQGSGSSWNVMTSQGGGVSPATSTMPPASQPLASLAPPAPTWSGSGDWNAGYRFVPNTNGTIKTLGLRACADAGTFARTVTLYDANGTVLATASVNPQNLSTFWYVNITPVNVTTNNSYVVAVRSGAGQKVCWNNVNVLQNLPDPVTTGGGITILDKRYTTNGAAFPTTVNTSSSFIGYPDVTFQPATVNATGWVRSTWTTGQLPQPLAQHCVTGDLNADGRTDIWCTTGSVRFSMGNGWRTAQWTNPTSELGTNCVVGDINGDGQSDFRCMATSNGQWSVYLTAGAIPDLVTAQANGIGGTTRITYTPSSAWPSTNNPPLIQTASSVTVLDGRGGSATTTYSYAGALWDAVSRRALGFRYSKEIRPCNRGEGSWDEEPCPYTETWFKQDYGSVSKPEVIKRSSGAGILLAAAVYEYQTNGSTVPYTSVATGLWGIEYDGAAGATCPDRCKRTYVATTYDAFGNLKKVLSYGDYDAAGDEKTVSYTRYPNVAAYIVEPVADVKTFDGLGTTGALLNEAVTYYDGHSDVTAPPTIGNPTKHGDWLSTTNSFLMTAATFDAFGNTTSTTDALGNVSTIVYDSYYHQFVVSTTNALGQTATHCSSASSVADCYDAQCGAPIRQADLNGQAITMQYDALCRPSESNSPLGGLARYSYVALGDPQNQAITVETPSADGVENQWTKTYFDGLYRPWRAASKGPTAAQSIYQDTKYNARGAIGSTTLPYYVGAEPQLTTTTYDVLDRPVRVTAADGSFVQTSYGLWSVTSTDEGGHQVTETFDSNGRPKTRQEVLEGVSYTSTNAYNIRGHLSSTTDPAGNVMTFSWDSLGRKTAMNDPDLGNWTYDYDALSRLTSQTDALHQTTTFAYDGLGRLRSKSYGTQPVTLTWVYDEPRAGFFNVGHLTSINDPSGNGTVGEVYNYDAAGRGVQRTRFFGATAYTFETGFDAGGRTLWNKYPDGDSVGTAANPIRYDGAGRVKSVPDLIVSASYDALGQPARIANANGTVTKRTYSAQRGWLTRLWTLKGLTTIQDLSYGRDVEGAITDVTSPMYEENWHYSYDGLHRLTSAKGALESHSFTYDAIGNILSNSGIPYTYNASGPGAIRPHAVTTAGTNSYSYDANGNMISSAGRTLVFDANNKPTSIDGFMFAYDANGARLSKTVNGLKTAYIGDDFEIAPDGTATKYVSLGDLLVAKRVGTTSYWLHVDQLGSVQSVTDSSGSQVLRHDYRPYGARQVTYEGLAESRGYIGQREDETGLLYLHARYYDPALSRFISADPTTPATGHVGLNRYAYANNNPIQYSDASGLDPAIHVVWGRGGAPASANAAWRSSGGGRGGGTGYAGLSGLRRSDLNAFMAAHSSSGYSPRGDGNYYFIGAGPDVTRSDRQLGYAAGVGQSPMYGGAGGGWLGMAPGTHVGGGLVTELVDLSSPGGSALDVGVTTAGPTSLPGQGPGSTSPADSSSGNPSDGLPIYGRPNNPYKANDGVNSYPGSPGSPEGSDYATDARMDPEQWRRLYGRDGNFGLGGDSAEVLFGAGVYEALKALMAFASLTRGSGTGTVRINQFGAAGSLVEHTANATANFIGAVAAAGTGYGGQARFGGAPRVGRIAAP